MTKSFRQGQILRLVRAKPLYTQDELAMALKAEGIAATQVTLSRDLRELHLVKTASGYQQLESQEESLTGLIGSFLRDIRVAQNQIILRTDPGHASVIAVALDQEDWPEIAGTIAGDDTILIIAPDNATAGEVKNRLMSLLRPHAKL